MMATYHLRHRMLHFMQNLVYYMMVEVMLFMILMLSTLDTRIPHERSRINVQFDLTTKIRTQSLFRSSLKFYVSCRRFPQVVLKKNRTVYADGICVKCSHYLAQPSCLVMTALALCGRLQNGSSGRLEQRLK